MGRRLGWILLIALGVWAGSLLHAGAFTIGGNPDAGFNPYLDNTYHSAAVSPLPACSATYLHIKAWVKDETTACTVSSPYASGGNHACELQCDGVSVWYNNGSPIYGS